MSMKIRTKLDYNGIGRIFQYAELNHMLASTVEEIKERCGKGYGSAVFQIGKRYVGRVQPNTAKARKDNMENNTLLKNMH